MLLYPEIHQIMDLLHSALHTHRYSSMCVFRRCQLYRNVILDPFLSHDRCVASATSMDFYFIASKVSYTVLLVIKARGA